ncbi:radical SAM protein [Parafilimonas sp.]|uniref:radical SAM protein n=1 Tax=Parafilimonas sp. TaxID=1969739 RepID=UPI0039E2821F
MHDGYDSHAITQLRSKKNKADACIPYHFLHEKEPALSGDIETVNTIFLTSKECAFKCLMCDLWKNTLDEAAPFGAIIKQIEYALERLPQADVIKLYNNGNFFDTKAISPKEYPAIVKLLKGYKRVVVENHPKLCNRHCIAFNEMLDGRLEVAMGLETIHPGVLPRLNKQLTPKDFKNATGSLNQHNIDVRAFVLLNAPYITDPQESIVWTLKSIQFAFECGVVRCAVIPVRPGNGVMDVLWREGNYAPPSLAMLEDVFEKALLLGQGQVFVDTWDIGFLSTCTFCFDARKKRLEKMNLEQKILPEVRCSCSQTYSAQTL